MYRYSAHPDATLTIDLDAVAANYRLLRDRAKNAGCAAVVKADAYGLGVAPIASKLAAEGCRKFFVATLDEGVELRGILKDRDIYIFHGVGENQEKIFGEHNLIPVLNEPGQIERWRSYAAMQQKNLCAILHVDTGMNRLGLNLNDAESLAAEKDALKPLQLDYVMSHLACAATPEHPLNAEQLKRFNRVRRLFPGIPGTLANSAGTLVSRPRDSSYESRGRKDTSHMNSCHVYPGNNEGYFRDMTLAKDCYHFDLVRPGCSLYGVYNFEGQKSPLSHVVTLTAKIMQVRRIDTPQTVGYGAAQEAAAGSILATVPVGYADGYLRYLSHRGVAYLGDTEVPVMGRVSMDMIVLDVTKAPEARPGMEVTLLDHRITVDRLAGLAGTIGYEILTSLGKRYKKVYHSPA